MVKRNKRSNKLTSSNGGKLFTNIKLPIYFYMKMYPISVSARVAKGLRKKHEDAMRGLHVIIDTELPYDPNNKHIISRHFLYDTESIPAFLTPMRYGDELLSSMKCVPGYIQRDIRSLTIQTNEHINIAARSIQTGYRGFIARKQFLNTLKQKVILTLIPFIINLQSIFKMYRVRKNIKFSKLVKVLLTMRNTAAIKIQSAMRMDSTLKRVKLQFLTKQLRGWRNEAGRKIQRRFRMKIEREQYKQIIKMERSYNYIKWPLEGKEVEIVTNFTNPRWKKELKLWFCPLRKIFVKYLKNLRPGVYQLKYKVDGQFRLNPHMPVMKDPSGNENNVFIVKGAPRRLLGEADLRTIHRRKSQSHKKNDRPKKLFMQEEEGSFSQSSSVVSFKSPPRIMITKTSTSQSAGDLAAFSPTLGGTKEGEIFSLSGKKDKELEESLNRLHEQLESDMQPGRWGNGHTPGFYNSYPEGQEEEEGEGEKSERYLKREELPELPKLAELPIYPELESRTEFTTAVHKSPNSKRNKATTKPISKKILIEEPEYSMFNIAPSPSFGEQMNNEDDVGFHLLIENDLDPLEEAEAESPFFHHEEKDYNLKGDAQNVDIEGKHKVIKGFVLEEEKEIPSESESVTTNATILKSTAPTNAPQHTIDFSLPYNDDYDSLYQ